MAYPSSMPTRNFILRYKGLFDFDGLYNTMVQYLKANRYWFHEYKYKHKVPSPLGAEQEIFWKGEKKITEYIQYRILVAFHLWEVTEVEVVQKGVKKTLTNARMEIQLRGWMDIDYEKRYETSTFLQNLKDFYNKYIVRRELESIYWDTLHYRCQKFLSVIKDYLDMQAKGYEYRGYLGDNV
jgi:hypothetical protein